MDIKAWIDEAKERVLAKPPNSPAFELKELFTGDEWNTLAKGEKSTFGKVFASQVRAGEIEKIQFAPIGKSGRHNRYVVF